MTFVPFYHFIEIITLRLVSGGGAVESALDLHWPGNGRVVWVDQVEASWNTGGGFDIVSEINLWVRLFGGNDVVGSRVELLDFTESKIVVLGASSVLPFLERSVSRAHDYINDNLTVIIDLFLASSDGRFDIDHPNSTTVHVNAILPFLWWKDEWNRAAADGSVIEIWFGFVPVVEVSMLSICRSNCNFS